VLRGADGNEACASFFQGQVKTGFEEEIEPIWSYSGLAFVLGGVKMLFFLLRLFLLYLLFRFLFKGIFLFTQFLRNQPNNYGKNPQETSKNAFDNKNVIDAEFKEIK